MAIRLKVLDGCPVRLKTGADETVLLQTGEGYPIYPEPYTGEYEITPTESEIGLQTNGLMMTSDVTVHGIPTDYVGSAIDRRDSSSISVSGPDVTVPLGYYEDNASVSIANGSAAVPSLNIEKNPTISVSTGGLITATVSTSETVSPVIQAGYVDSGTSGTITFSGTATQQLTVKSSSDLSISGPTVTAPAGFYADNASATVSSGNIGNPNVVRSKDASYFYETISYPNFHEGYITSAPSLQTHFALEDKTVTPSTTVQTVGPTGDSYYLNSVTVSAVTSGSAGTPTATKGTVTNHSVTVTPSVTNSTGYITGGTKTGTGVTVSASELVSGSETKTSNGTYDVTNLASLVVNVSGGGGIGDLLSTTAIGAYSTSSTQATNMNKNIAATNVNGYDVLLVETSVDTEVANRHMATVGVAFIVNSTNAATKNAAVMANAKWNAKLSSSSVTQTTSSTTAYGIYPNSCTMTTTSNGTATFAMYSRYNSSRSGTINGTYTARVYGIKLCDLIGG